jgi:acetoin utilization protein AcuB
MQVREMMSTDVTVIDRNDDVLSIENIMNTKHVRHLPVVEDGDIVGMVSQRDIFKAAMSSTMGYGEKAQQGFLHSVRVKAIMVYPVVTVSPDMTVDAAIELMLQKGIGCLPVVDNGQVVGMLTKTDLLRRLQALSA